MSVRNYLSGAKLLMSDNESFRRVYEDHLTFFKNHQGTIAVPVTDMQLYVYEFDWIGLLNELGVPLENHWFTIRLNGGECYTDVPKNIENIIIPDLTRIKAMYSTHISRKKLKK